MRPHDATTRSPPARRRATGSTGIAYPLADGPSSSTRASSATGPAASTAGGQPQHLEDAEEAADRHVHVLLPRSTRSCAGRSRWSPDSAAPGARRAADRRPSAALGGARVRGGARRRVPGRDDPPRARGRRRGHRRLDVARHPGRGGWVDRWAGDTRGRPRRGAGGPAGAPSQRRGGPGPRRRRDARLRAHVRRAAGGRAAASPRPRGRPDRAARGSSCSATRSSRSWARARRTATGPRRSGASWS